VLAGAVERTQGHALAARAPTKVPLLESRSRSRTRPSGRVLSSAYWGESSSSSMTISQEGSRRQEQSEDGSSPESETAAIQAAVTLGSEGPPWGWEASPKTNFRAAGHGRGRRAPVRCAQIPHRREKAAAIEALACRGGSDVANAAKESGTGSSNVFERRFKPGLLVPAQGSYFQEPRGSSMSSLRCSHFLRRTRSQLRCAHLEKRGPTITP
jgi:hypothetical protein